MRIRLFALLTLISLLVLTACGATASNQPLKIVFSAPVGTDWGQGMMNAAQLAFAQTGGKIGNVAIELVMHDGGDEENKEVAGVELARDDAQVVAFVGAYTSGHAREIIPVANELRLPVVSTSATWPGLTKTGYAIGEPGKYYPNGERMFFRVVPSDDIQGRIATEWFAEQGYQKIFIVGQDNTYSVGLTNIVLSNVEDFGITVVGNAQFDEFDFSDDQIAALVEAVRASEADAVYFPNVVTGGEESRTYPVLHAIHRDNPERPIMGADGIVGGGVPSDFADLTNVYATSFRIDLSATEAMVRFANDYNATYGVALSPSDYDAVGAYEALQVVFNAIARAGANPTRASVLQALRDTQDYNGILGTWSFDPNGDTSFSEFAILTVGDGGWVTND